MTQSLALGAGSYSIGFFSEYRMPLCGRMLQRTTSTEHFARRTMADAFEPMT
jgi:hypothetical protein